MGFAFFLIGFLTVFGLAAVRVVLSEGVLTQGFFDDPALPRNGRHLTAFIPRHYSNRTKGLPDPRSLDFAEGDERFTRPEESRSAEHRGFDGLLPMIDHYGANFLTNLYEYVFLWLCAYE